MQCCITVSYSYLRCLPSPRLQLWLAGIQHMQVLTGLKAVICCWSGGRGGGWGGVWSSRRGLTDGPSLAGSQHPVATVRFGDSLAIRKPLCRLRQLTHNPQWSWAAPDFCTAVLNGGRALYRVRSVPGLLTVGKAPALRDATATSAPPPPLPRSPVPPCPLTPLTAPPPAPGGSAPSGQEGHE